MFAAARKRKQAEITADELFAEFGVRLLVIWLDLMLALFLSGAIHDYVLEPLGLEQSDHRPVVLGIMFLYFTGSWLSQLKATPLQWLLGMRIVDRDGERLSLKNAALRSAALVGLVFASLTMSEAPGNHYLGLVSGFALVLAYLAVITPNRQAAHDMLAGSFVVTRRALKAPEHVNRLRAHVTDTDPETRRNRRPPIYRMFLDTFAFGAVVFVLFSVALMQHDRELRYRVGYATSAVAGLKSAVAEYYDAYSRWPDPAGDLYLGADPRGDYPDGGYYQLEADGQIRIRFTVLPQLTRGSIVFTPSIEDSAVNWQCQSEGDIAVKHLPSACRH